MGGGIAALVTGISWLATRWLSERKEHRDDQLSCANSVQALNDKLLAEKDARRADHDVAAVAMGQLRGQIEKLIAKEGK